jgi:hypothetical protein
METIDERIESQEEPVDDSEESPQEVTPEGKLAGNRRRIGVPIPYTEEELTAFKDDVLDRLSQIEDLEHDKKAASDRIGGSIKYQHGQIRDLRTKISEGVHHEPVECELILDWDTKTRRWVNCETKEVVETETFWDSDYQRDMFETERENERRATEADGDEDSKDLQLELQE